MVHLLGLKGMKSFDLHSLPCPFPSELDGLACLLCSLLLTSAVLGLLSRLSENGVLAI